MTAKTAVTRAEILDMDAYSAVRDDKRRALIPIKRARRVAVGPDATFHFESYDTMWLQIHEMLFLERGGEDQIDDELQAYNPLLPKGNELVATVMFQIDDPARRRAVLSRLGGVEDTMVMEIDGEPVRAMPEQDVDRATAEGKAASVHFVHFRMTPAQIAKFVAPGARVTVGVTHPSYGHIAILPEETRAELAKDLQSTDLQSTDLRSTDLRSTDLRSVDLQSA